MIVTKINSNRFSKCYKINQDKLFQTGAFEKAKSSQVMQLLNDVIK